MAGDDPGSAGGRDDGPDVPDGDPMRGWIDPDDRLWRHPSERHSAPPDDGLDGSIRRPGTGSGWHAGAAPWLICGSLCVALVVAAVCVIIADTGQEHIAVSPSSGLPRSAPTTEPGSGHMATTDAVDPLVAGVRPSTVAIDVTGASGTSSVMGLVVEAGGIIVTTARALDGAKKITVVESDGSRHAAEVVGADQRSDLAVVRIDDDMPAATFDDDDPVTGSLVLAVAMRPGAAAGHPTPVIYAGTVVSSGITVAADATTATFAATSVRTPLDDDDIGCPLLDSQGHVVGMLELTTRVGTSEVSVFLPGGLVAGVARQLVSSGVVEHGWLGVEGVTMPPTPVTTTVAGLHQTGALLASVTKGSPAALAGLDAGDVVTAVDGAPVHSMAELMTRLYPDPPGTSVVVTFDRSGVTGTTEVELADPTAASTEAASP